MSDEKKDTGTQTPDQTEAFKNLKAEMDRKFANLQDSNKQLLQALQGLKPTPKPQEQPGKSISELIYEDPDRAVSMIEDRVTKSVTSSVNQALGNKQQEAVVLGQLVKDYPELSDSNSPLTMKAVEIYNNLSPEERQSPSAYKLAAREAAADMGVLPASKRSSDPDDFTFKGGSKSQSVSSKNASKAEPEDEAILETARIFGVDINDPKTKERVLARKRDRWGKYQ